MNTIVLNSKPIEKCLDRLISLIKDSKLDNRPIPIRKWDYLDILNEIYTELALAIKDLGEVTFPFEITYNKNDIFYEYRVLVEAENVFQIKFLPKNGVTLRFTHGLMPTLLENTYGY